MPATPARRHPQRGFTLLEMAIVLAVIGIILSVGVPSYRQFQLRQQLRSAGDAIAQDLRHARELSVSSRAPIFINYRPGKQWCWGVSRGQPCDCSGTSPMPACNLSRGDGKTFSGVILENAQDAEFSPGLGQVTQTGSATLRTEKDMSLKVVLNAMGRASICGPDARGSPAC